MEADFRPLISIVRKAPDARFIEVTLDLNGWIVDGSAAVEDDDLVGAACRATCEAVNTLMPDGTELALSWSELLTGREGRRDVVNAAVVLTDAAHDSTEELIGAAFVRSDAQVAAVRATLDALTRRLGRFAHL